MRILCTDGHRRNRAFETSGTKREKIEQTNEDSGSDDDMDDIVVPDDDVTSWKRDASHVLTRVRQKLQGQEEPNGEALGVAGQV